MNHDQHPAHDDGSPPQRDDLRDAAQDEPQVSIRARSELGERRRRKGTSDVDGDDAEHFEPL